MKISVSLEFDTLEEYTSFSACMEKYYGQPLPTPEYSKRNQNPQYWPQDDTSYFVNGHGNLIWLSKEGPTQD